MKNKLFKVIKKPIEIFVKTEASSGILLAICALIAMQLANSSFSESYFSILNFKIFNLTTQQWINDALMAIFFFVIGMEIKKELVAGELASPQKAALPVAAAIGGMIAPALIYYTFNNTYPDSRGWGIPMATDIAFALGVLTLFGKRVPLALKVFLLAIAIVDDLGAILVIAFFYTSEIKGYGLGIAAGFFALVTLIKYLGIRHYFVYVLLGGFAWFGVLLSGVHATIAGVLLGLLTPLKYPVSKKSQEHFSPLDELVGLLHPWVSYLIMPVFALANSGITLTGIDVGSIIQNNVHLGVVFGLFIGKPVGIFTFSRLATLFKIAELPRGLDWKQVLGVGFLGGIGFTMALFISGLALLPEHEVYSKTGILLGSIISAIVGSIYLIILLRFSNRKNQT